MNAIQVLVEESKGQGVEKPLIAAIRLYKRWVSPAIHAIGGPGCGCRFVPTCSHYAIECIEHHGPVVGSALAARRVMRCGPWNPGGVDPAPLGPFDSLGHARDRHVRGTLDRGTPSTRG